MMNVDEVLDHIRNEREYEGQLSEIRIVGARGSSFAVPSRPLPDPIQAALQYQGIGRLYTHQSESLERARQGENLLLVTPTASGKTLCYNLPVAEGLLLDAAATALYIFPTKALAQDQKERLRHLMPESFIETYDGDTPTGLRRRIRDEARVVLTNPDMLHLAILPYHANWNRFLGRLRYVVIDEVHTYRGVFGSHMAHVLQRLQRICELWGSRPQFILASATSGNPEEHAQALLGKPLHIIEASGAPLGRRTFAFWDPDRGRRGTLPSQGYVAQATWLLAQLVQSGVRTILFARARQLAEWILVHLGEYLSERDCARVRVYRGGYLPSDRRAIERQLFSGELVGVVSTTALELGVDIGGLDAAILLGFPGSMASVWQQAGRAGRSASDSLAVYIPTLDVLDRFLLSHPDYFFERPYERAVIDPQNPYILVGHVLCAAFEHPIDQKDFARWGPMFQGLTELLTEDGRVNRSPGDSRWYFAAEGYPAEKVSLRSADAEPFILVREDTGETIGTIDSSSAPSQAFPGAVYLQAGESYVVSKLDFSRRTIHIRPEPVDYNTEPAVQRDVEILSVDQERLAGPIRICFGELRVESRVHAFRRRHAATGASLGQAPLDLPPASLQTMGLWMELPQEFEARLAQDGMRLDGAVHAVEHALVGLLPLFASTDRWDIAGTSTALHPAIGKPAIFVYDGHPGGVGFAERGYEEMGSLLQQALKTVSECPCEKGCPSCIQSPKCGHWNNPLDKRGAVLILEELCRVIEA